MLLEAKGKKSAGKWSCHLNIRFSFITDQKEKGNISIEFCLTYQMIADYITKPLDGKYFKTFKQETLNEFANCNAIYDVLLQQSFVSVDRQECCWEYE